MQPTQAIIDDFVGNAHGNVERVRELVEQYPAVVTGVASWGETAFEAAAQMAQRPILELLLAHGLQLDIFAAIVLGRDEQARAFLQADPDLVHARGAHGIPVLYYPVIVGNQALAELLLSCGAELNAGAGAFTPLHGAALFNQPAMARWLVEHGADISAPDYEGKTALEIATANGHAEVVGLLS